MRSASMFSGGHQDDVDYISWNPSHPDLFCTSSQKDKRLIWWDARRKLYVSVSVCISYMRRSSESRPLQTMTLKTPPLQTTYSPDGKSLLYTTTSRQMFSLTYGKENEEVKDSWHLTNRDPVCRIQFPFIVVSNLRPFCS